ncbi:MAG: SDR family NAD(P)-dependent oxidoreductase [Thermoanaerobaculales bacterium]|jgi:NADP-dependent 3-hydroxy acid dehydrogenase YdfG|nr:SDR family NAD(P)-dependent oxidoreductase [Thermoanaerobaculales bacterium]
MVIGQGVAVVTGASSGIGRATTMALAAEGWRVALLARRVGRLEALAAEIAGAGGEAMIAAVDCADGAAVAAAADRVRSVWAPPSLLVNSAGAGVWRFLEETRHDEIDAMIGAPYLAAAHASRAFLGDMIAAGRGRLIHVGSPASIIPWPGATAYAASRWALRGLHEALRQDLRGTGVTSSLVTFGEVSSEYFAANPGSRQFIPKIGGLIPVSTPERCAEVILGVVRRPRATVYHPLALALIAWSAAVLPGPTRWLIAGTGRRH